MTVYELIKALREFNPDAEVVISEFDGKEVIYDFELSEISDYAVYIKKAAENGD